MCQQNVLQLILIFPFAHEAAASKSLCYQVIMFNRAAAMAGTYAFPIIEYFSCNKSFQISLITLHRKQCDIFNQLVSSVAAHRTEFLFSVDVSTLFIGSLDSPNVWFYCTSLRSVFKSIGHSIGNSLYKVFNHFCGNILCCMTLD